MDQKLRKYIGTVLEDNRMNRLDDLDAALTSEQASRTRFFMKKE